ncbi:MAG: transglycosylase domain-containing protein [Ferruginibacter sp.]
MQVKRSVSILWKVFFWGMAIVVLLFTCANFGLFGKMPSLKELENPEADLASEVYTADGKLMGKYYSENRSEVKYHEISPNIINALIATEDERFKEHSGIDGRAVARALISLGKQGGGSTITQQLAKMMLGQGRGNILTRGVQKIKEWIVAVKLERNFTKEEIVTLYLNRAPWGSNYGIRNASRTYYQKEPSELNIEEAAVLVGMLKGFIYDPVRHPKASVDRRNTVIDQMENAGYVTAEQAVKLKAKPLITNYKKPDESVGIAPYFRAVLADKLKDWCKTHKNLKTGENYDLYRDGLKIYTTIDSKMQQFAEESVVQHMPVIQRKLNSLLKVNGDKLWKEKGTNVLENAMKSSERWRALKEEEVDEKDIRKTFLKPVKMKVFAWNAKRELDTIMSPLDSIKYHKQLLQTSFVAMDPKSGEVKCWVGGIDFRWFKFDHVTTKRQVGSTFKPFIYTLAVQEAGYTPDTYLPAGALTLGGKTISGKGGTLANCLAFSKNLAAWRLIGLIGVKRTIEFVQNCGIKTKLPPYYSIGLGSAEIPMLEMLQGYTIFPNKGYDTEPVFISRIEDKNGNLLQEFATETKQVITEQDAYTMVKLMQGVVKIGTGRSLNSYDIPAEKAGKTGTTNDNTDGWFIGYTPELLAGTWVGCDDPFIRIYAGTSGGNEMALPKWGYFMKRVYADKSLPYGTALKFEEPSSFMNDPVYADVNFDNLVNKGEEENIDQGNPDAQDFMETPLSDYGTPETPIESEIKTNVPAASTSIKKDTVAKVKTETPAPAKPSDKKDVKATPANTPAKTDDKKKTDKPKEKANDY